MKLFILFSLTLIHQAFSDDFIPGYLGCFPGYDGNELLHDGLSLELAIALSESRPFNTSLINSFLFNNPRMTQEMCFKHCKDYNFPYTGVNDGSWCGCGKSLTTSPAFAMVEESKCDLPCEGNFKQKCGAFNYFNIFKSLGGIDDKCEKNSECNTNARLECSLNNKCQCPKSYKWDPKTLSCSSCDDLYTKSDLMCVGLNTAYCDRALPCLLTDAFGCEFDSNGSSGKCKCRSDSPFEWDATSQTCSLCKAGYELENNKCVALNSMTCNSRVQCKSDSGLECDGVTCQCTAPKSWDVNSKKCDKCTNGYTSHGVGSPCTGLHDDQCSNSADSDLKCASIENLSCSNGKCKCDFPYVWNPSNQNCLDLQDGYYMKDGKLTTKIVCNDNTCPIVCSNPTISCDSDNGLTCKSNHCECTYPYEWNAVNKNCDNCASNYKQVVDAMGKVTCVGLNNAQCGSDIKCFNVKNFFCNDQKNKCECDYAYAWSDKNEDCKQCDDKLPYVWDKTTETCDGKNSALCHQTLHCSKSANLHCDSTIAGTCNCDKQNKWDVSVNSCQSCTNGFFPSGSKCKGFNDDACDDKNPCLEDSDLTCGKEKKCKCTSPYSWNANDNKCSSCVENYELVDGVCVGLKDADCSTQIKCKSTENFYCDVDIKTCQCMLPYLWNMLDNKCSNCILNYELDTLGKCVGLNGATCSSSITCYNTNKFSCINNKMCQCNAPYTWDSSMKKCTLKYEGCFSSGKNWELLEGGLSLNQASSIPITRLFETSNGNQVYNHPFLTTKMCMEKCSSLGFPYAGLIDASWCACGKSLNMDFKSVDDSICSYPCIGDPNEKCGAFEYYSIYTTDVPIKTTGSKNMVSQETTDPKSSESNSVKEAPVSSSESSPNSESEDTTKAS